MLLPAEQTELSQYEACIERGIKVFVDVGNALLAIRDKRLYRAEYASFEEYCWQRWNLSRPRAYQLMDAAGVVNVLSTVVDSTAPTNEAQARALVGLEPEAQRAIWQVVQATAPDGKITAGHIKSVAHVLKEITSTGALDNGDGESIPAAAATLEHLKAAVTEETYERMLRQEAHISSKAQTQVKLLDAQTPELQTDHDLLTVRLPQSALDAVRAARGSKFRIVVYELQEQS